MPAFLKISSRLCFPALRIGVDRDTVIPFRHFSAVVNGAVFDQLSESSSSSTGQRISYEQSIGVRAFPIVDTSLSPRLKTSSHSPEAQYEARGFRRNCAQLHGLSTVLSTATPGHIFLYVAILV